MARPKLQIHPAGLVVIVFGLLAWLVALGGVGAASYDCQKSESYALCAKDLQWEWWSCWFDGCMLLALFGCAFNEPSFRRGRLVLLAFFVLATSCTLQSAHNFITHVALGPVDARDLRQDAINAAAAGFVLLSLTNFVLIIVLGRDFGLAPGAGAGASSAQSPYLPPGHGIAFQTSAPV